jgi:hypothetical protein
LFHYEFIDEEYTMVIIARPSHMSTNSGPSSENTQRVGAGTLNAFEKLHNKSIRISNGIDDESNLPEQLITEKFNLNSAYLLMLARIMDQFSIFKANSMTSTGRSNPDVYYPMWEQLDLMENTLACKQSPTKRTEYRDRLRNLLTRIKNVGITNDQGMFVNDSEYMEIRYELGVLFEDLLINMEERGLLTFKAEDPLKAMSKFDV